MWKVAYDLFLPDAIPDILSDVKELDYQKHDEEDEGQRLGSEFLKSDFQCLHVLAL